MKAILKKTVTIKEVFDNIYWIDTPSVTVNSEITIDGDKHKIVAASSVDGELFIKTEKKTII